MTLAARFQFRRGDFALNTHLEIPDHGVTAIFGPSGSGKTTLLRAVAGLERGENGYLRVGEDLWQDGDHFLPTHRRPVGFVFQEASLFSHLSVRRNLRYGLRRVSPADRRLEIDDAVSWLGLEDLLDRGTEDLSGGERQRVAIGQALLTSPRLLLLDEPLTGLDAASKQEILPYLEHLCTELDIPVLYVSHAADEVARLADHLVLLHDGEVLATGPIAEMLTRFDLPLAHGRDAEAIVEARVSGHDEAFHLTRLEFAGGDLQITREELAIGQPVRLRVLARDVSLTLLHQTDTSILNILPVKIEELAHEGVAQVMVKLTAGDTVLLSRITRKSAQALDLEPGKLVFAQIKTVALLS